MHKQAKDGDKKKAIRGRAACSMRPVKGNATSWPSDCRIAKFLDHGVYANLRTYGGLFEFLGQRKERGEVRRG
jgi:hypothetical protein